MPDDLLLSFTFVTSSGCLIPSVDRGDDAIHPTKLNCLRAAEPVRGNLAQAGGRRFGIAEWYHRFRWWYFLWRRRNTDAFRKTHDAFASLDEEFFQLLAALVGVRKQDLVDIAPIGATCHSLRDMRELWFDDLGSCGGRTDSNPRYKHTDACRRCKRFHRRWLYGLQDCRPKGHKLERCEAAFRKGLSAMLRHAGLIKVA